MKQFGFKHKCKFCRFYKYDSGEEHKYCLMDGHAVPNEQCRCVFGKKWFQEHIREKQETK